MKRYFVTGAQGFVGRYVVARLLSSDGSVEVLGIGRSPRSDDAFTHSVRWAARRVVAPLPDAMRSAFDTARYRYVPLDLRRRSELGRVLRDFQPEVVIHLASALRDDAPSSLVRVNIQGTLDLLAALAQSGVSLQKLVLGSTGGVYGAPAELPIRESASCNPVDLYSASKLAAEQFSRILARQHRMPAVWARLFNLAGPGQDERHICGRFAAQAAAIAEGAAPPVIEVGALEATRDFIDVRDAASALLLVAEQGACGSAYNLASGIESPARRVLELTLQLAGLQGRVRIDGREFRASDVPRHFACIERLRSLGFDCRLGLSESIRDLLNYYRHSVRAAAQADAAERAP